MDEEQWAQVAPVEFSDHYEISNRGRVRRSSPGVGTSPGRVLKLSVGRGAHPVVKLTVGGVRRSFALSSLVAASFLPPKPPGAILMHHDGEQSNCAAGNLYRAPNSARCNKKRKLSDVQVAEILALRGKLSGNEIARRYEVSARTIIRTWRRGG